LKTEEEFRNFFDTTLRLEILPLEEERKKVARKVRWAILGGVVAGFFCLALLLVIGFFAIIALVGLVTGWLILYKRLTGGFETQFKEVVIRKVVAFISKDLSYFPDSLVDEQTYLETGLFPRTPDRYRGDDLVEGALDKTSLRFSEVHSEYKTETRDSKGNRQTRWVTIFRGLFFVADFNKDFKGRTLVMPDAAEKFFGKLLGQMFQSWNKGRGELVKLEDPDFEKAFVVYATDQIEARYVLSTSLIRRILDFVSKTRKDIHLSFFKKKVAVAVSYNRALFEAKVFSSLLDFNLVKTYFEDMALAVGIVEELNLNTRIWTKS